MILIKQMHQRNLTHVIIGIFLDKGFKYEPYLCNGCHDLMEEAMNFNDVAIVPIKRNDYRIHFWYMSKDDAINIMKNSNLNRIRIIMIFVNIKDERNNLLSKKYRGDAE